mgnify:FL=1
MLHRPSNSIWSLKQRKQIFIVQNAGHEHTLWLSHLRAYIEDVGRRVGLS